MIRKYVFGNPFETGAVVLNLAAQEEEMSAMAVRVAHDCITLSYQMDKEDVVYGLGEQVRGINKRGYSYVSYAADEPDHTEDRHSLYGAHNFLIVDRKTRPPFGIFIDNPGKVTFDVGGTKLDLLEIAVGKDCVAYVIEADTPVLIAKEFRKLIGRSYIAPKWAFGYQQSRWGYKDEADIREVADGYHKRGIPLDAIYMDIDYMERYKDFTVDKERFPDLPGLSRDMKERGIHLVPIIDAGVKVEAGYPVYEEGVANNYFCKDEDGNDFVGAVWPGLSHFPDVLNTAAREWFGNQYKTLIDQGIDGFWNDMNEPALFYSEKRIKQVFEELSSVKNLNMDIHEYWQIRGKVDTLSNNIEDYKSFYHNADGVKVRHDKVHNLYGFNMTRAAAEGFERIVPDKRILIFSRSSYIGMHRYGGIWTGDNASWWSHILLSIQQMPGLNLCGILYTGSDIGGFGGDTTQDLLLRWLEFGIFTPLMRNHTAIETRLQEAYQFENTEDFRNIIRIRYALLPYIYSEYMKAALTDGLYFRALSFDFPDDAHARSVEDQLMVGESIMIAPVYTQNAIGRYVYLPEEMLMVRMKSPEERICEVMEKGHHFVNIALNEVVIFVKKNHMLPFAILDESVKTVRDIDASRYEWIGYADSVAEYTLYDDDGISKSYVPQETWQKVARTKEELEQG